MLRLALFLSVALATTAEAADPATRNVVLIVADDLGLQLGCYGDTVVKTPALDRLAADGTRFTRAHCTTASCSPSRSVILSGLYGHTSGQYGLAHADHHFSTYDSVRSLPILLSEAGYRTCSIGKVHVSPEYVYHFDAYRNEGTQGHHNPVRMAENAKAWITEESEKPFFLYWCPTDVHRAGDESGFANSTEHPGVEPVEYDPKSIVVPPWLNDTPIVREELAEYYQAVSRLDQGVGRLLDVLDETGHADDTLVIFMSDNGPPWPGAKTTLYEPGTSLPLLVRDPRQETRGVVCDALVNWTDITPTILDYCGVEVSPSPPVRPIENAGKRQAAGKQQPYRFHGRSFAGILDQEHPEGWTEIFASHSFHEITMYYPMRSITSGKHKYIVNFANDLPFPFASDLYKSPTWQEVLKTNPQMYGQRKRESYLHRPKHELYDLEADPNETTNLADDPDHQQTLVQLQEKVRAWQQETNDPWVSKWEYE